MWSAGCDRDDWPRLVRDLVAEHGEQDVDAAAGQADQGGVVAFALGSLAVVVGTAGWVGQGSERGEEECEVPPVCRRVGYLAPVGSG